MFRPDDERHGACSHPPPGESKLERRVRDSRRAVRILGAALVLSTLLLFLSWTIGRVWSPRERHGPVSTSSLRPRAPAPNRSLTPTDARVHDAGVLPESARRELVVPRDELVTAVPSPADAGSSLVRVQGHLRRAGRPLAWNDLSFQVLAQGQGECDWGFTDEEGLYEVELSPARYAVRTEDGSLVTEVIVPEGREELALDLDLGLAR